MSNWDRGFEFKFHFFGRSYVISRSDPAADYLEPRRAVELIRGRARWADGWVWTSGDESQVINGRAARARASR